MFRISSVGLLQGHICAIFALCLKCKVLSSNQAPIDAQFKLHKLIMCSLLSELTFSQYYDLVCPADGGETMGDDDSSPVAADSVQRFLHDAFSSNIDGACSFVENKE